MSDQITQAQEAVIQYCGHAFTGTNPSRYQYTRICDACLTKAMAALPTEGETLPAVWAIQAPQPAWAKTHHVAPLAEDGSEKQNNWAKKIRAYHIKQILKAAVEQKNRWWPHFLTMHDWEKDGRETHTPEMVAWLELVDPMIDLAAQLATTWRGTSSKRWIDDTRKSSYDPEFEFASALRFLALGHPDFKAVRAAVRATHAKNPQIGKF